MQLRGRKVPHVYRDYGHKQLNKHKQAHPTKHNLVIPLKHVAALLSGD